MQMRNIVIILAFFALIAGALLHLPMNWSLIVIVFIALFYIARIEMRLDVLETQLDHIEELMLRSEHPPKLANSGEK